MNDRMTFFISFFNVWTLYVIKKIRVEAFCITWDLFRRDDFIRDNNFENIFFK